MSSGFALWLDRCGNSDTVNQRYLTFAKKNSPIYARVLIELIQIKKKDLGMIKNVEYLWGVIR